MKKVTALSVGAISLTLFSAALTLVGAASYDSIFALVLAIDAAAIFMGVLLYRSEGNSKAISLGVIIFASYMTTDVLLRWLLGVRLLGLVH